MPRSSSAHMAALRTEVFDRAGWRCEWPRCGETRGLQLAHLESRGMGGRKSVNRAQDTACLCRFHHDLLDGRTHRGLRREMVYLLRAVIGV